MKSYSFKLDNPELIKSIDTWQENGYTIRGIIEYLIAKYAGLELPKPNEVQRLTIEINRQREEIEHIKKDLIETVSILISLTKDVEILNASLLRQSLKTNSPSVEEC